jgi:hypothetical protein
MVEQLLHEALSYDPGNVAVKLDLAKRVLTVARSTTALPY